MAQQSLQERILEYLKDKSEAVPTSKIAKDILGTGAYAKDVNSDLYKLLSQGKLTKLAEPNGTRPRWLLKQTTQQIATTTDENLELLTQSLSETKIDDISDNILQILSEANYAHGLTAIELSRLIYGADGKSSIINPYLYSLYNKHKIGRRNDAGSRPIWFVCNE